jgi:hypothetical protein
MIEQSDSEKILHLSYERDSLERDNDYLNTELNYYREKNETLENEVQFWQTLASVLAILAILGAFL